MMYLMGAACAIALIAILVAIRCVWIDYAIKGSFGDYRTLRDSDMKFSDTPRLFQQSFPSSAKKYKKKR